MMKLIKNRRVGWSGDGREFQEDGWI